MQPSPRSVSKAAGCTAAASVKSSARTLARSREAQAGSSARGERARRGQETLSILESGGYVEPTSGEWVDVWLFDADRAPAPTPARAPAAAPRRLPGATGSDDGWLFAPIRSA